MKNKKTTAPQTTPQRTGCWNPTGWIAEFSARVQIEGDRFGTRFLGGAEFIVFRNVDEATKEAHIVLANQTEPTTFEVQEYRAGKWYTVGAGVNAC